MKKSPHLKVRRTPNNTNPGSCGFFKSRRFHLILNPGDIPEKLTMYNILFNKYSQLIKYLTKFKCFRYLVSGLGLSFDKEDTEHLLHIHIYVEYKESNKLAVSKCFGAHIINKIDSQLNVINYVKSQELGIIEEIGNKALAFRPSIGEIKKMKINELNELDSQQYYNIVSKEITRRNNKFNIDNNDYKGDKLKVFYIYGSSGSGKSRLAHEIIKKYNYQDYDKIEYSNNFYIGVSDDSKACIYDDFRPSDMKVNEFIKFIDYYINNLNVKGGSYKNNYELIIITSIRNPHNIYRNCTDREETNTQWIRRMNIINMDEINDINQFLDTLN